MLTGRWASCVWDVFGSGVIWVWVKIKPLGIGPQVLVHVSICQGKPFWVTRVGGLGFG